ncbi:MULTISPECIES: hypothetical protein [Nostocales]|nr:hypothetical protein [Tolypothrix bouteillei]
MKQMHLVGFMHSSHVVLSHGIWRHPQTELGFLGPEFYQTIAQTLERGKFDMVFFADALAFPDECKILPAITPFIGETTCDRQMWVKHYCQS